VKVSPIGKFRLFRVLPCGQKSLRPHLTPHTPLRKMWQKSAIFTSVKIKFKKNYACGGSDGDAVTMGDPPSLPPGGGCPSACPDTVSMQQLAAIHTITGILPGRVKEKPWVPCQTGDNSVNRDSFFIYDRYV